MRSTPLIPSTLFVALSMLCLGACGQTSDTEPAGTDKTDDGIRDTRDLATQDMVSPDSGPVDDQGVRQDMSQPLDQGPITQDMAVTPDMSPSDLGQDMPIAQDMAPVDLGQMPDMSQPDMAVMIPDYPADWPRSRGWTWVREQEPFVTALSVRMGPAPQAQVDQYFDDFNANAVHLWEWGLPDTITSWKAARPNARWLTWLDKDGQSPINGQVLGGTVTRPAGLIGYQIGDEPRDRAQFNAVIAGFNIVKTADPAPLRILNFTFQASEIDTFLTESCASGDVDIFSYDRYSFGNSQFETMMKFRNAALACGIPYWRYVKGYINDVDREKNELQTNSDMRWDAFSGLLAGFTGHTWFLYNVLYGTQEGIPTTFFTDTEVWGSATTPRFMYAADINQELIAYGRAQTKLRSTAVSWVPGFALPGSNPPSGLATWQPGTGGDVFLSEVDTSGGAPIQDLMIGVFEDRYRDRYVMILNPNHTHGSFPNESDNAVTVNLTMNFANAPANVSTTELAVLRATGVVESVPVTSGSKATFVIPAGDVIFYKYVTGNGFEGYR